MKKNNLDNDYLMLALYKIELLKAKEEEYVNVEFNNEPIETEVLNENIVESDKEKEEIKTSKKKKKTKTVRIVDIKNTRVNNTFVAADKEILNKFKNKWSELDDYTLDRKYGAYVCELIDVTPVVASNDYLVLTHKYDSFVDKGNTNISNYEDVIKKILKEKVKIVFITDKDWNIYKKEYIENNSKGIKYQPIEEIVEEIETIEELQEDSDIINKANELFDNIEIEIEE